MGLVIQGGAEEEEALLSNNSDILPGANIGPPDKLQGLQCITARHSGLVGFNLETV